MTDRRRSKKKRSPARAPAAESEPEPASAPPRGGLLRRALTPRQPVASPFPPLTTSIRRAAMAAGAFPLVQAIAFLGLLVLWAAYALLDVPLSAEGMVYIMGLPPLHVPIDVSLVQSLLRSSSALALGSVLVLGVARGLLLGSLALLLFGALRGQGDARASLRRLPKVAVSLFGIYGVEVALFLFALAFIQAILGPAAALVMLVVGLHFLGFAPVIAAAEAVPAGAALRLGFRTARMPGGRHLGFVLLYFATVVYAGVGANSVAGPLEPATPSILTWGLALLATFGHVVMLGALAVRWDAVRERVLEEHGRREAERRGARGRGGRAPTTGKKATGKKASAKQAARPTASEPSATTTTAKSSTKRRSSKGRRR